MAVNFIYKIASEDWEFEKIHQLNYKTFVEEIPQHPSNHEKRLVDRFHQENVYVICLVQDQLVGMVAFRNRRPFSLDSKLENLDSYLPQGIPCEIRLLAIEPTYRKNIVFYNLVLHVAKHALACGNKLAVISGTVRQQKLYRHLGFVPFGPLVGKENALYQPMYLTLQSFCDSSELFSNFVESGSNTLNR